MAKENGSIIGRYNNTSISAAVGVFTLRTLNDLRENSNWPISTFSTTNQYIAAAILDYPLVYVYRWSSTGFGTKFTDLGGSTLEINITTTFNPNSNIIAFGSDTSPFVYAYAWSSSGFGSKFANPSTLPAGGVDETDFHPAGTYLAVTSKNTPYMRVYNISSSGFGAAVSSPATVPTGASQDVKFSPSGNTIAFSVTNGTNGVYAYPFTTSFGTKYADPTVTVSTSSDTTSSVAFDQSQRYLLYGNQSSPYVYVWNWSPSGFGSRVTVASSISTDIGNTPREISFDPSNKYIAIVSSGKLNIYNWNNGFGSKIASPTTPFALDYWSVKFSKDTGALAVGDIGGYGVQVYRFESIFGSVGSKFTDPATQPFSGAFEVSWG